MLKIALNWFYMRGLHLGNGPVTDHFRLMRHIISEVFSKTVILRMAKRAHDIAVGKIN